jgi:hypothetical protein
MMLFDRHVAVWARRADLGSLRNDPGIKGTSKPPINQFAHRSKRTPPLNPTGSTVAKRASSITMGT